MGNADIDRPRNGLRSRAERCPRRSTICASRVSGTGATVGHAVDGLEAETERVCGLAQELSGLARKFAPLAA